MVPPNNVITLLKEARRIARLSLIGTGYQYPGAPVTLEQAACITLCHALDVARVYTQLIEDDYFEKVIELERTERPPHPW